MIEYEGPGWRLVRDCSRKDFPYVIGGDGWSVELSETEWKELIPLIFDLISQHKKLRDQLMPEEKISLEIERKECWVYLDGNKELWSLKVIIDGKEKNNRSIEVYWPIPNAQLITSAMRTMWDSRQ